LLLHKRGAHKTRVLLLVDNFDSFSYNLVDYLGRLGVACQVHRNTVPVAQLAAQPFSGVVLSPGPEQPAKAGHLMPILAHYAGRLPVLGVCLGHQAIGTYYGARLAKAQKPMHGKISRISAGADILFNGLPGQFNVVRYHSLLLQELPACLEATAFTAAGEVMALRHKTLPLHGIQFHPEAALTEHGLALLDNWIKHYGLR